MERITPKKSLSQNFLTSERVAERIAESLAIEPQDLVIEIGPGTGALTKFLIPKCKELLAIEVDERAVVVLKNSFSGEKNFSVRNSDFREFDFSTLNSKCRVIGNVPYSITADLVFHVYQNHQYVKRMVFMVQKEVAQRVVAKPNTKEYGVLTVATNLVGKAKVAFDVSAGNFFPRPKVTSSVFVVDFNDGESEIEDWQEVLKLAKVLFQQRRKMIGNSIKSYASTIFDLSQDELQNLVSIDVLQSRPENLTADDFVSLYALLKSGSK